MKELESGWTVDQTVMHFGHIPIGEAEALMNGRDDLHIVETINGTYDDSQTMLHRNKYFAMDLAAAIGLAAQLELTFLGGGIAEQVVAVRRASDDEADTFWAAYSHFNGTVKAISD